MIMDLSKPSNSKYCKDETYNRNPSNNSFIHFREFLICLFTFIAECIIARVVLIDFIVKKEGSER